MLPGVKPSRELLMSDVDVRSTASPPLRSSAPPTPHPPLLSRGEYNA